MFLFTGQTDSLRWMSFEIVVPGGQNKKIDPDNKDRGWFKYDELVALTKLTIGQCLFTANGKIVRVA